MSSRVRGVRLPAEWEPQDGVQLTWPHADGDWAPILAEVTPCFVEIARQILQRESCLIVCRNIAQTREQLRGLADHPALRMIEIDSNDTWARDHGPISLLENGELCLLDFTFNGWGMKFAAHLDNLVTRKLFAAGVFAQQAQYRNKLDFVLEGGSIESDGQGTLLTTEACLLSVNRNEHLRKKQIEGYLATALGAQRVLWLQHGWLAGDDTDSHIDTLARFCNPDTIAYVRCQDQADEHYHELAIMEEELRSFRTDGGQPYRLLPLPMARPIYEGSERLPATYANFLIINGAVLMPTYAAPQDAEAMAVMREAFPAREVVGVDCRQLLRQHGSLHCVTMQYAKGCLNNRVCHPIKIGD